MAQKPQHTPAHGPASGFSGGLAFVVTIAAAYASGLPGAIRDGMSWEGVGVLVLLGAAYTFIGTYGDDW